jgi:hypothetical protein
MSSLRAWHPRLRTTRLRKRVQTRLRSYLAALVSVPRFLVPVFLGVHAEGVADEAISVCTTCPKTRLPRRSGLLRRSTFGYEGRTARNDGWWGVVDSRRDLVATRTPGCSASAFLSPHPGLSLRRVLDPGLAARRPGLHSAAPSGASLSGVPPLLRMGECG